MISKGVLVLAKSPTSLARMSTLFFLFLALQIALLALMAVHAVSRNYSAMPQISEKRMMVRQYGLTDLCLFTEARYTRHPTLADLHSSFQDGPLSIEHFPSGALAGPPPALRVRATYDD